MYKVALETIDRNFRVFSDVEIGKWAMENLDMDKSLFSDNSSVSVKDLIFKTREELNFFKLAFNNKYHIREYKS